MSAARISFLAKNNPLPCLPGRVRVGCERSELQAVTQAFGSTPKHKQPLPNPPLPLQGRELAPHASTGTHA